MALASARSRLAPLESPAQSLPALFEQAAERNPTKAAIVEHDSGDQITYPQLLRRGRAVARHLERLGIQPLDRVALLMPASIDWCTALIGISTVGAISVPISANVSPGELREQLEVSDANSLVTTRHWLGRRRELSDGIAAERRATLFMDDWLGSTCNGDAEDNATALTSPPENPCMILFTSGTTGRSKGATHSTTTALTSAMAVATRLCLTGDDRVCLPVPMHHCLGSILGALAVFLVGGTIVLPGTPVSAATCLDAIHTARCSVIYGVPALYAALLDEQEKRPRTLGSLRTGIIAGAPVTRALAERTVRALHLDGLTNCYGMTEAPPIAQTIPGAILNEPDGSVGSVQPGMEIRLIDPLSHHTVTRGDDGELVVRGTGVMLGYWNDPEATSAAQVDGWLRTGDVARMDENGHIRLVGRLKDIIIRSGENIVPSEIEECLTAHPAIRDAQVVGVPDTRVGEDVCAWIVLREGTHLQPEDVRAHCRLHLSLPKVPRHVWFTSSFPQTSTGKTKKSTLREWSVDRLNEDNEQ